MFTIANTSSLRLVLVLGSLTLLPACNGKAFGGDAGANEGDGGSQPPSEEGRTFLFQSAMGFTPVENTTVRLSFQEGSIGFSAGCNIFGGSYSLQGDKLIVTELGSTNIGCEPALAAQDDWLAEFITSSPTFDLDDNDLTLADSEATLRFLDRRVADPDRPLIGSLWSINTLISGPVAQGGFPGEPTVTFDAQGQVHVFTGCNTGTGEYSATGPQLSLSAIAYTEQACANAAFATTAQHVQSVFSDGTLTFEIEAARMTLMHGDLGIMAITE